MSDLIELELTRSQTADVLQAESGYTLSSAPAADFQAAILGGRWSEALSLLPDLGIPVTLGESSSGSSIASGKTKATGKGTVQEQARFLISQQKYLELLEVGQQKRALGVLRGELAPVIREPEILHGISGWVTVLARLTKDS